MTEQPKTVLVVDDQINTRSIIARDLREGGYTSVETTNARLAIEIASRDPVDLILLDVNLPEIDGFTACKMLKANPQTAKIPVIICTARGMKQDVMMAAQSGAAGYIVKPVNKKTVLEKVRNVLSAAPAPPPSPPPPASPV